MAKDMSPIEVNITPDEFIKMGQESDRGIMEMLRNNKAMFDLDDESLDAFQDIVNQNAKF
jgi:hypothetical protein